MNIPTDYNQLKDLYLQQNKRLKAYVSRGINMRSRQIEYRKGFKQVLKKMKANEAEFDRMLNEYRLKIGEQAQAF